MHVTGRAFHIILSGNDTYYNQTNGMTLMNNEIYRKLDAFEIDWEEYDLWRKGTDGLFYYERDNYIDMIFKVHRHRGNTGGLFEGSGGYAYLGGVDFLIDTANTIRIYPNFYNSKNSGVTIFGTVGGPVGKIFAFNVARHEYGHCLYESLWGRT